MADRAIDEVNNAYVALVNRIDTTSEEWFIFLEMYCLPTSRKRLDLVSNAISGAAQRLIDVKLPIQQAIQLVNDKNGLPFFPYPIEEIVEFTSLDQLKTLLESSVRNRIGLDCYQETISSFSSVLSAYRKLIEEIQVSNEDCQEFLDWFQYEDENDLIGLYAEDWDQDWDKATKFYQAIVYAVESKMA